MKDSFVMYNSFYEPIKTLKNEQLGKLLRAIFDYTINGEITQDSEIIVPFMFIKNQLDMDLKKWQDIKRKRSEAGKKHTGNQYTNDDKWNKMEQNGTNGTVNVNENVNVNVINKKENIKRKSFIKPTLQEVEEYCKERNNNIDPQQFIDFYESKGWKVGNQSMKDWKACVRTWEKRNTTTKVEKPLPDWLGKEIVEQIATNKDIAKLASRIESRR